MMHNGRAYRALRWGVLVVAMMLVFTACGRAPTETESNTTPPGEAGSMDPGSSEPAPGTSETEQDEGTVELDGDAFDETGSEQEPPGDYDERAAAEPAPQPEPQPQTQPEPQPAPEPQPEPEPAPLPQPEPVTVAVDIAGFAFRDAEIEIRTGDTVVWTNRDEKDHTVTGDGFDSGNLDEGETFTFTFDAPGDYPYICAYHPSMKGVVKVLSR